MTLGITTLGIITVANVPWWLCCCNGVKTPINAIHHFFYDESFGNDIYDETKIPKSEFKNIESNIPQTFW